MTIRSNACIGEYVDLDHSLREELQAMLEARGQPVALGTPANEPTDVPMTVVARQAWAQLAGLCRAASPSLALS